MPDMRFTLLGILALLAGLTVHSAAAQTLEQGALITATAEVSGFRFARTVIFLVHHDDDGSLGLIVNRPTRLAPAEAFDALSTLGDYEGRVFVGGPVVPTRPLMLINDTAGLLADSEPVLGSIHITADPEIVRRHAEALADESRLRVFAGHVQWEPGRLEDEVTDGVWRVVPGSSDTVFSENPGSLHERLGGGRDSELVAALRRAEPR